MRQEILKTTRRAAAVLFAALCLAGTPAQAQQQPLLIFAAASLKNALDEVDAAYVAAHGGEVKVSYGGSSALARQIEQGAPADVFISADLDWMDYLDGKSLVRAGTRTNLLGNRIVLIAPEDSRLASVELVAGVDVAGHLDGGRLAMALVESVPAGKYGKAALEALGAWNAVAPRVAQAENVRAALLLVSRGEAPLGIVYKTDATADQGVRIVGTFPENAHPPIIYPAAVLASTRNTVAAQYLAFLRTPAARAIFERHGFVVLAVPAS